MREFISLWLQGVPSRGPFGREWLPVFSSPGLCSSPPLVSSSYLIVQLGFQKAGNSTWDPEVQVSPPGILNPRAWGDQGAPPQDLAVGAQPGLDCSAVGWGGGVLGDRHIVCHPREALGVWQRCLGPGEGKKIGVWLPITAKMAFFSLSRHSPPLPNSRDPVCAM